MTMKVTEMCELFVLLRSILFVYFSFFIYFLSSILLAFLVGGKHIVCFTQANNTYTSPLLSYLLLLFYFLIVSVLILGVTGVSGQLAIQVSRGLGAGNIIGLGRNQKTLDELLKSGKILSFIFIFIFISFKLSYLKKRNEK